jgi:hypothetical protein
MAMGGVPHYLKRVSQGESAQQAIDKLYFEKDGLLRSEFKNLYQSLFDNAQHNEAIVRFPAGKASGFSWTEIISGCGFTMGGETTRLFGELEESGFITQYVSFGKTSRDAIYRLTDEYSLFYLKFIESSRAFGAGAWHTIPARQSYIS